MFLGKKHWAERIVRESGIPDDGRVFGEVRDMLITGAEQCERAVHTDPAGRGADDLDFLLMSARAMPDNRSAVERLVGRFDLSEERAQRLMDLVRQAAYALYEREGRSIPLA